MSMDHEQSNLVSRRALLAVSAAALAGSAVPASAAAASTTFEALAENPDAHLIGLCKQWEAHRQEFDAATLALSDAEEAAVDKHQDLRMPALWSEVHADSAYRETGRRVSDLVSRSHSLYQEIGQTRAVTLAGLLAKARVTAGECRDDGGIEEESAQYNDGVTPQYMALALVRDLLAIVERGGELDLPAHGGQA
jgi:hypothetical protein